MIKSICIVRLSAFGDVLMLIPLIRTLQDNLPLATITWVISKPAFELVNNLNGVEFIVINKLNRLSDYWQFAQQLKHKKFDVLLACQASLRANLLYTLIKAPRKIGYDKLRAKDGHKWFVNETIPKGHDHTLDGFLKFAEVLGARSIKPRWDLTISKEDESFAHHILPTRTRILLVNPAASKPERSWSIKGYVAVIKAAKLRWNMQIVLTGGPGAHDKYLADEITRQTSCINLVGKTKPKQLIAIIKQADLMLCPDTGPSHMAAAVGTPVIALHAVTSAQVSGPYTYKHLAVDYYPQAVTEILHKTLATNVWGKHVHGKKTMSLITVDAVLARFQEILGKSLDKINA